jgi:hypothetical protein
LKDVAWPPGSPLASHCDERVENANECWGGDGDFCGQDYGFWNDDYVHWK